MKLYIAGILHQDPLCRIRLKKWIKEIYSKEECPPKFIATEWDENIHARVINTRKTFCSILKNECPDISSYLLDSLKLTIGYEADIHKDVFPNNVDILWVDPDRYVSSNSDLDPIENYAEFRVLAYKQLFSTYSLSFDDKDILENISKFLWQDNSSEKFTQDYGEEYYANSIKRDNKMKDLIINKIKKITGNNYWVLFIVGNTHSVDNMSNLNQFLKGISSYPAIIKKMNQ